MGFLSRKVDEMREFAFVGGCNLNAQGLLCPEGFFKIEKYFIHNTKTDIVDGLLIGKGKDRVKLDITGFEDTQRNRANNLFTIEYLYLIRFVYSFNYNVFLFLLDF